MTDIALAHFSHENALKTVGTKPEISDLTLVCRSDVCASANDVIANDVIVMTSLLVAATI